MAAGEIANALLTLLGEGIAKLRLKPGPLSCFHVGNRVNPFPRVLWFRLCTIHLAYYEVGLGCFLVVGSFAACLLACVKGRRGKGRGGLN